MESHYKWAAFVKWLACGVSKNWPNLHLTGSQFSFTFGASIFMGHKIFAPQRLGPFAIAADAVADMIFVAILE